MTGDEEIIGLFFSRSEQAIQELDSKYGKACRKLAYNIVNSEQDAEECVNDSYLGAWNAIPPSRPSPLIAFILKIVRNVSLNRYWKAVAGKRNARYTVALAEVEDCLGDSKTVETEMDARELARMLEGFLETLEAKNRIIFLRRYWFADSCREIAGVTGLTEKNVSVRLTRIRGKLREYLEERDVSV